MQHQLAPEMQISNPRDERCGDNYGVAEELWLEPCMMVMYLVLQSDV